MGLRLAPDSRNNKEHHLFEEDVHDDDHDGVESHEGKVIDIGLDVFFAQWRILLDPSFVVKFITFLTV